MTLLLCIGSFWIGVVLGVCLVGILTASRR